MEYSGILNQIFIMIAVLVALVNIITEVAKNAFDKLNGSKAINLFVLLISVVLTVVVFLAYWQIKQMEITWYIVAAFIVAGIMVAYAAMFGYDKLIMHFEGIKK